MSTLDPQTIRSLSHLARLELTEEERSRYADQLSSVVGFVEQLSEVNTDQVKDEQGVTGNRNVAAEDKPRSKDDLTVVSPLSILAGAPAQENNYFMVRAALGDEIVASQVS